MPVRVAGDQFSPVICLRDTQRLTYQLHSRCSLGWSVHSHRGVRFSSVCVRRVLPPLWPFPTFVRQVEALFLVCFSRWPFTTFVRQVEALSPFFLSLPPPFCVSVFPLSLSRLPSLSYGHTTVHPFSCPLSHGRLIGLGGHSQRLFPGSLTVPLPVWASPSAYVCYTCVSDGRLRPPSAREVRLSTKGDIKRGSARCATESNGGDLDLVTIFSTAVAGGRSLHRSSPVPTPLTQRTVCVCPWFATLDPLTVWRFVHRAGKTNLGYRLSASGAVGGVSGDYCNFSTTGCRRSS